MLQTQRVHPFPFRTRKLSSAVAKILCGRLHGKIAQCRHGREDISSYLPKQKRDGERTTFEKKETGASSTYGIARRKRKRIRGCSSVGRAPALQAGGHEFESHHLHQSEENRTAGTHRSVRCMRERFGAPECEIPQNCKGS